MGSGWDGGREVVASRGNRPIRKWGWRREVIRGGEVHAREAASEPHGNEGECDRAGGFCGGRDRASKDGAERGRWGMSNCRGISWRTGQGCGERDRVGGILWATGREMKGCDRNFDRRASEVPQAGREGEMRSGDRGIGIRGNGRGKKVDCGRGEGGWWSRTWM